ncbi:unnamed protein product, partial [marine sediment metagenome]
ALDHGMSLKDCSAFNIQFIDGKPIFIDTLSFEKKGSGPWIAYKQFCQHFLAPLALMIYTDVSLNQMLRVYIDGIPLNMASSILPMRTRFKPSLLHHIHIHAKSQKHFGGKTLEKHKRKIRQNALLGMIDNLESTVRKMQWVPKGTEWSEYYSDTNYSSQALVSKQKLLDEYIDRIRPTDVWDLGANNGFFSRTAADKGIPTIAFDIDPAAVEKNYLECVRKGELHILPLLLDLTNPSSGIGWGNEERMSLR